MRKTNLLSTLRFPAFLAASAVVVRAVVACSPGAPEAPPVAPVATASAQEPAKNAPPKDEHGELDGGGKEKWLAADGATVFEREVTTKRSDADVQAVFRANAKTFRKCYEAALPKNPGLAGKVNVRFTITPDGKVDDAKDEGSTLPSAGVVNCVITAFQKLKFPAVKGASTTIVYPLVFDPGN